MINRTVIYVFCILIIVIQLINFLFFEGDLFSCILTILSMIVIILGVFFSKKDE